MARKGWDSLSASYRGRLERKGITRVQYDSGASLQRARGHTREGERLRHAIKRFDRMDQIRYGNTQQDLRDLRRNHSDALILKALTYRRQMTELYEAGNEDAARYMYDHMPAEFQALPDWMRWYHGAYR